MDFFQRLPLLLITAALLVGGVFENDIGSGSQAMLAVGFVCLGSWLTIEVQTWHQKLRLMWEDVHAILGEKEKLDEPG